MKKLLLIGERLDSLSTEFKELQSENWDISAIEILKIKLDELSPPVFDLIVINAPLALIPCTEELWQLVKVCLKEHLPIVGIGYGAQVMLAVVAQENAQINDQLIPEALKKQSIEFEEDYLFYQLEAGEVCLNPAYQVPLLYHGVQLIAKPNAETQIAGFCLEQKKHPCYIGTFDLQGYNLLSAVVKEQLSK